jgi:hypothetical protein
VIEVEKVDEKWALINETVKETGKHIILDLSGCTTTGNTFTGRYPDPTGNDFNIIKNNEFIKGIIFPDTTESIGEYAFDGCSHLTGVSFPDGLLEIKQAAFGGTRLTSVVIPANVTSIAGGAFFIASLTRVVFEGSETEINQSFRGSMDSVYEAHGGPGTYTRAPPSSDWTYESTTPP